MRTALTIAVIAFGVMVAAGCNGLEEDVITQEGISAAKDISVSLRNPVLQLTVHNVRHYMRDSRLFIEGGLLNSSPRDVYDVALRVVTFDGEGRVLDRNKVVYPIPRSLSPGVIGHFRIKLDPTGVAAVAIEVSD